MLGTLRHNMPPLAMSKKMVAFSAQKENSNISHSSDAIQGSGPSLQLLNLQPLLPRGTDFHLFHLHF
jgi:hypothetical protein